MKKFCLYVFLLTILEPTVAQQPTNHTNILDPTNPNSNTTTLAPARQAALEAYTNETVSNQVQNDLDSSELDKVILDGLFAEIVSAPRVAQARLDFSDIQFERVTSILTTLQASSAALTKKKMAAICSELDFRSTDPNNIQSINIAEASLAAESNLMSHSQDLLEEYQQAIQNINELLGTANSEVFQDYLSKKRNEAISWRIIELPEMLEMFSTNPQALALQCNQ